MRGDGDDAVKRDVEGVVDDALGRPKKSRVCPACGETYWGHPALSRRAGALDICPRCGLREALEDFVTWVYTTGRQRD